MKIKKYLLAFSVLGLFVACDDDNEGSGSVLSFSGNVPSFTVALGSSTIDYAQFETGDEVGIFVGASTEKSYTAASSGSSTSFTAGSTVLTSIYGDYAHILVPVNGDLNGYYKADIEVPKAQTVTDGKNPNVLNLFGSSAISGNSAEIDFTHYGGVLALGFYSSDEIHLARFTVEATDPASGSYMAGTLNLSFDVKDPVSAPTVGDVDSGSNTITVTFADSLVVSETVQYVPIGVLPFSTDSEGLTLTFYDTDGYPCYYGEIFTDNTAVSYEGTLSIDAGEVVFYDVELSYDDFDTPKVNTLTVIDNATLQAVAGKEVEIYYDGDDILYTYIGTYTTDDNGEIELELPSGDYWAYCSYDGEVEPKSNSINFTMGDEELDVEFMIYPVLFYDDFEWLTSDMDGTGSVLEPLYAVIDPATANTNGQCQFSSTTEECQAIVAAKGWELSSYIYMGFAYEDVGVMRLGKKSGTGTAKTPALNCSTSSTMLVKITALPWHTVSNSVWKYEPAYLTVSIYSGNGSFSDGSTSFTSDDFESEAPDNPFTYNYFEFTVVDASDVVIQMKNAQSASNAESTLYRVMIDDFAVLEVVNP